jgi:hypothetical protein
MSGDAQRRCPRRRFTDAEDQTLRRLVGAYGLGQWETIARYLPERSARQCHERYDYYLSPSVYSRPWTPDEDALLEEKVAACGSRWVFLVRFFPGRNSNQLKNRWYGRRRRRASAEEAIWESPYDDTLPWDEFSPFDSLE